MNISIVCVGKLKEDYLKSAITEYKKRLSRFTGFEIIEVPDQKIPENAGEKIEEQILNKEGELIISKIKNNSYIVAMCIEGKQLSSEELAHEIKNISMSNSNITFIIGGSLGLSKAVKQKADMCISFGKITLPHQLMRVVLSEQIYRAFKINANEAYHK